MSERDRQILRLAVPSIVSNITVPLLGLVDVAIMGHMGNAAYIGAISVGSMIFNVIYWVFGFLRMGTSGLTSQALGRRDLREVVQMLGRAVAVGGMVALALLILQVPVRDVAMVVIAPGEDIIVMAKTYFNICVWGAPAMLALYGMTGWLIGMQNTRFPMMISITQNVVNILASLWLVFAMGWGIEGVAWGTVVAQYTGFLMAAGLILRYYGRLKKHAKWEGLFDSKKMLRFFKVNSDIFFRTICLVAVNLFFLSAGARQGDLILAVNTLLMQLYILFSYFLDGFAFAGEALCGRYYGADNSGAFRQTVVKVFVWGVGVALFFTLFYTIGGQWFIGLLTSDALVVESAVEYLPWAVAVPLAGVVAFVWDGVFVGITATKGMLLSSVVATLLFFAFFMVLKTSWGNHALWLAFIVFLLARGAVQTLLFCKCHKK